MTEGKATILVVDDEEHVRKLLQRILEEAGYSVVTAANGREALDTVSQCNVNLVLLDIKMPGLDGFQVLDSIRQRSNMPVIMLTGKRDEKTLIDALNGGADDYIRKPLDRLELLARIKAKLRRSKT